VVLSPLSLLFLAIKIRVKDTGRSRAGADG
jgi:hypothetical protein